MIRSQNGYPANNLALTQVYTVPGTWVQLRLRRGPCAQALLIVAARFDDEVEDIDTAGSFLADARPSVPGGEPSRLRDDWSYAERPVRGQTGVLSNHASGTGIDLNATQHPRGVRNTFTGNQERKVNIILDDLRDPQTGRRVIRWGEDYQSSPVDGMHFEIDADEPAVRRAVAAYQKEHDAVTREDRQAIVAAVAAELAKDRRATVDAVADEVMARLTTARIVPNLPLKDGDPQGRNWTIPEVAAAGDRKADLSARADAAILAAVKEIHAAVVTPPAQ